MLELRKMGPLPADHPAIADGETCPCCRFMFHAGDVVTLVPKWVKETGPVDPSDVRGTVACDLYHWACTAEASQKLDQIAERLLRDQPDVDAEPTEGPTHG